MCHRYREPASTVRERWGIPVPDQSQQYQKTSPPKQQGENLTGDPSDTSGNVPANATPESLASNTNRTSEGQQAQADQTINQDPTVETRDENAGPRQASNSGDDSDNYGDEDAWPFRSLRQEAKGRGLNAGGDREEIIARLRAADQGNDANTAGLGSSDPGPSEDVPRASVEGQVDNGGIQRTEVAQQHAEVLQGLSNDRRQQQLAAVKDRSSRSRVNDDSDGDGDKE